MSAAKLLTKAAYITNVIATTTMAAVCTDIVIGTTSEVRPSTQVTGHNGKQIAFDDAILANERSKPARSFGCRIQNVQVYRRQDGIQERRSLPTWFIPNLASASADHANPARSFGCRIFIPDLHSAMAAAFNCAGPCGSE